MKRIKLKENIKIAAFDVDGTILPNGNTQLSENTVKMFKELKEQGIITVIASAREFVTIGDLLEQSEADYFVGANGTFIYDIKNKKIIFEKKIKFDDLKIIYDVLLKDQNCTGLTVMDIENAFYSPGTNIDTWFFRPHHAKMFEMDYTKINKDHLHIITVVAPDMEKSMYCSNLCKELFSKYKMELEVNSLWTRGLFVCPPNVTKSKTLEKLCDMLGFTIENLIAFGDSSNDFEMIRDAYYGVAMTCANEKVKEIADDIALDCEYDGAYWKLKELKII